MTSSANDEWDYYKLKIGISELQYEIDRLNRALEKNTSLTSARVLKNNIQHTIDFIEYNMREMEIKPLTNNGN